MAPCGGPRPDVVGKDLNRSGGAASFSGAFGDHDVVRVRMRYRGGSI